MNIYVQTDVQIDINSVNVENTIKMNIYQMYGIYDKVRININWNIYIVLTYYTILSRQIKKL